MQRAELGGRIYEVSHVKGDFVLSSGQPSDHYFDKYQFEALPELLQPIAAQLVDHIPPDTDVLAGLDMGGVPIATALSLQTGLPQAFVRKEAKKYGTRRLAEGVAIGGKNVTVIEDVITSGKQIVTAIQGLRVMEANVGYALCVIERSPEGRAALQASGVHLTTLFTATELKQYAD